MMTATGAGDTVGVAGGAASVAADVATAGDGRTFPVLVWNVSRVEAALAALVKRCARKGLTPIAWTWGKAYTRREHVNFSCDCIGPDCGGCRDVSRCPLTILGETPRYAGWSFLASLEHLDGENITRTVPGETLPAQYRTRGPQCDHCRLARRRNDTYVLRHEDGRVIQVGSTCIADFLGSDDAGKIADAASMLAAARGLAEDGCEDGMGGGSDSGDRTLAEYFPLVAWAVRVVGWTSRTAARESGRDATATADITWRMLMDPMGRAMREGKVEITDEDKATAVSAEQWAENLSDVEVDREAGDYLHNVRAIARTGLVKHRTAGIAASIITAYQRAVARERERARRAALPQLDAHVGTAGKRETFAVMLDFVTGYETAYGYTTVCKFRTAEGATLVWKASNTDLARGDVGKVYALTGTVKKHDDYKGAKQTIVTRCAVVEAADMAAATVLSAPKVKGARARKGKEVAAASVVVTTTAAGDADEGKGVSGA